MGLSKSSSKREVYSNTTISQEERKASNRQPNSTSKAARKRRTKTSQSQQKEGDHKNQSRNKWKRNEGTIANINKTKNWFFEKIKLTNH